MSSQTSCIGAFFRATFWALAATLLAACGGGGGDGGTPSTPVISGLSFSPTAAYVNSGGGQALISGTVSFTGANGGVASVKIDVLDSGGTVISSTTAPVPGGSGVTSGVVQGTVIASTAVVGTYGIRVSMTDLAGIVSNALSGSFRVANNPWVAKAPMPSARQYFAVATTGGLAYVIGGELMNTGTFPGPDSALVEIYDPANNTWAAGVAMPTARKAPVAAAVNGVIYVMGGYYLGAPAGTSLVEAFDTGTQQWSTKAPMPTPRRYAAAAVVGGQICVFGGESAASDLSTTECYDPVANSWAAPPPPAMPTARRLLGADAIGGLAYAVGGYGALSIPQYLKTVERFDIAGPGWSTVAPMQTERESAAVVAASGLLFAFGGGNVDRAIDLAEAFNPATGIWSSKTPMPMALTRLGAVTIGGVVYVFEQANTLQYTPGDDLL